MRNAVRANEPTFMLSHCANSECAKPFLNLREGKLFVLELAPPSHRSRGARIRQRQPSVERYWLCDGCASQYTLNFDDELGLAVIPLRRPAGFFVAAC